MIRWHILRSILKLQAQNSCRSSRVIDGVVGHLGQKSTPIDGVVGHLGQKSTPIDGVVGHLGQKSTPIGGVVGHLGQKSTPIDGVVGHLEPHRDGGTEDSKLAVGYWWMLT
jgi:hypothetical protein